MFVLETNSTFLLNSTFYLLGVLLGKSGKPIYFYKVKYLKNKTDIFYLNL